MTIKTSRVDLKTLAASAAVVGALVFAPAALAQQTGTGQSGGIGQPGGVGQQEGVGQPSQMGQPGGMGQQERHGQPSQMGQPSGMEQPGALGQQDRYRQPGQMDQPTQPGHPTGLGQQQERYGQPSQPGHPTGLGQQQERYGQPSQTGQPGGIGHYDPPSQMAQPEGSTGTQLGDTSPENIRRVQEALKAHGQDLEVDGDWGPQTSSAVRKFQQEQGLNATGELDSATLQALGVTERSGLQGDERGQDRPQRDQSQDQQQR
jgi:hypothetical protein